MYHELYLMLQLAVLKLHQRGVSSEPSKSMFIHHQVSMFDSKS